MPKGRPCLPELKGSVRRKPWGKVMEKRGSRDRRRRRRRMRKRESMREKRAVMAINAEHRPGAQKEG